MSALAVRDLIDMPAARYNEEYILMRRDEQMQRFLDWKKDITDLRYIIAGMWSKVFKAEVQAERFDDRLKVQNYIADVTADTARLITESNASLRSEAIGRSEKAKDDARLVEAIGTTYWAHDRAERKVPYLGMDLAGDGGCFLLCLPKPGYHYSCHTRLDPLHVFPDISDDEMQDCLVVTSKKVRWVARQYPWLNLKDMPNLAADCEVIDYYAPDQIIKVVKTTETKGKNPTRAFVADVADNPIGRVPIAWAKIPTKDGAFRGLWNQAGTVVNAANRLMTQIMEWLDQSVSSERVFNNVANPEDSGPGAALVQLDPNQPATVTRVQPAPLQGGLFGLMERLEDNARGTLAFSRGRQGNAAQSIVSAAGLQEMQGQQVSVIRFLQVYGIGGLREMQTEIDAAWDRKVLNYPKPLLAPAGNRDEYDPRVDLPDDLRLKLVHGLFPGAGPANRAILGTQLAGALIIPREMVAANLDGLAGNDWRAAQQGVELQQVRDLFLQKRLSDPSYPDDVLLDYMQGGLSMAEANKKVMADQQAQQQAAQAAQAQPGLSQPGAPALPPGQAPAVDQALALQKGGIPGQTPGLAPPGSFAPPALANFLPGGQAPPQTQVIVANPRSL